MDSSDLTTEQPMPVPSDRPSVQDLVRADLLVREQIGRERYGDSLRPHNGRDALRDLYEELIDAALYARQAIEERPREDVDAAVAAVRAELEPKIRRRDDLIAELRRQYAAAERVRDQAVTEAGRLRNSQGWDPASPQWAVIRAAVAWRNWYADSPVRMQMPSDSEDALIKAVDNLPGPDRRGAARAERV